MEKRVGLGCARNGEEELSPTAPLPCLRQVQAGSSNGELYMQSNRVGLLSGFEPKKHLIASGWQRDCDVAARDCSQTGIGHPIACQRRRGGESVVAVGRWPR